MAVGHKDRLSPVDASFLAQEHQASHMHVGGVMIFEGPPPAYDDFIEGLESRLHLVPRYRQKLAEPRFEMGRPFWVDDPRFNIEYHVRHTALPKPGSLDQLRQLAGRVFSQRLDRSKPLWELWLVQGLEDNRFALISKTHHALVDGVSGVDISTVLFDIKPVPEPAQPEDPWIPRPRPSSAELVARGFADPAPDVPLNVDIGPHRRLMWARSELATFKRIKDALGGTVNDVVLTVVSGALRKWLTSRGIRTEGLELRALVPVSIRAEDEHGQLGNRIAAMRGPLPVYIADPVARLEAVHEEMRGLKSSKQA